jgi:hypothetical protein
MVLESRKEICAGDTDLIMKSYGKERLLLRGEAGQGKVLGELGYHNRPERQFHASLGPRKSVEESEGGVGPRVVEGRSQTSHICRAAKKPKTRR